MIDSEYAFLTAIVLPEAEEAVESAIRKRQIIRDRIYDLMKEQEEMLNNLAQQNKEA